MKSFLLLGRWVLNQKQGCLPPKMDGLYIMKNPIKMDDLGGGKTPIFVNTQMNF